MLSPSLWKLPCYKLMFLNSFIDILGVVNSCFISGYLSIQGVVFCTHPTFLYFHSIVVLCKSWNSKLF
ncbi:hypothetical protein L596_019438 [Steinernema carpocapsae]|uniref:Uncharacterized protein n=1 Tax=Steinernema carpocapsae TaxID=34508 RepID=A0A4U5MQI1_STECR|nr:hypothetical protein L596_019438 [Steinernema carpocapsae]